jgi:chromosome segregation ATPase
MVNLDTPNVLATLSFAEPGKKEAAYSADSVDDTLDEVQKALDERNEQFRQVEEELATARQELEDKRQQEEFAPRNDTEIADLRTEHEGYVADLQKNHTEDLARVEKARYEEVGQLRATVDAMRKELENALEQPSEVTTATALIQRASLLAEEHVRDAENQASELRANAEQTVSAAEEKAQDVLRAADEAASARLESVKHEEEALLANIHTLTEERKFILDDVARLLESHLVGVNKARAHQTPEA